MATKRKTKAEEPAAEPTPEPVLEEVKPENVQLYWRGIQINATYKSRDIMGFAHLELRVPDKRKIPVTDTGYRSHFHPPGQVEAAGGVEAFVTQWLDLEASTAKWKATEQKDRQLDLFD